MEGHKSSDALGRGCHLWCQEEFGLGENQSFVNRTVEESRGIGDQPQGVSPGELRAHGSVA